MKTRGQEEDGKWRQEDITVKVGESGFLFAVEQELSILCRHILGWLTVGIGKLC